VLQFLDWLGSLPPGLLYLVVGAAAFLENVFPPLPADSAIALGAFVAARGGDRIVGVWMATMVGNISGAMLMYYLGHRFGLPWLEKRFPSFMRGDGAAKFESQYQRYGIPGVVLSRFLPGVRAIVPPIAGAMHIGAVRSALAMTVASAVWYGLVSVLAFRAGANADALLVTIAASQKTVGFVALGLVAFVVIAWWVRRQRATR
jgi:membrane protein DedA with SNARE-associated domain